MSKHVRPPFVTVTKAMIKNWQDDALKSSRIAACTAAKPCSDKCGSCSGSCVGAGGQSSRRLCVKQRRKTPALFCFEETVVLMHLENASGVPMAPTRICTGCDKAFCFSCSPNSFCSQPGCSEVRCDDCSHSMFWCGDCERHFCHGHRCCQLG
jgi:hypothetical protein